MEKKIKKTKRFLKERLNNTPNISEDEKKYRFEHSVRVSHYGKEICKVEGGDPLIVELACLLHDCAKFEAIKSVDHGRLSAEVARTFLITLDLSQKQIDDICYAIAKHVDGEAGYEYDDIIEAKIVSDADNVDRFGTYRIYQSLDWDQVKEVDVDVMKEKVEKRIHGLNRLFSTIKLDTNHGDKLFKERVKKQIDFYNDYLYELNITILEMA
jgi:uncharacterized protein